MSQVEKKIKKRRRLIEVDRVTAFAIFLVVVGHIVARTPPENNDWYVLLKYFVYKFHMPLFMFLSGVVFFYTYKAIAGVGDYLSWAKKKVARLAPGFLLFGLIIIFGKLIASQFLSVDNLPLSITNGLTMLVLNPINSPAGSLWYIYVLLELFLLFPLLLKLAGNNIYVVVCIACVLHMVGNMFEVSEIVMLAAVFEYSFYFGLGALACKHYDWFLNAVKKYRVLWAILFILVSFSILFLPAPFSKTLIGLASIPLSFYLVGILGAGYDRLLLLISGYTFSIYLMNTLVIGLAKGIMLKIMPWDGVNFYIFFVTLGVLGLFAPIWIHKGILARIPYISRVTR